MILIFDNGSQYTHLIKRNSTDYGYESKIVNRLGNWEKEISPNLKKIEKVILSGGPGSVYLDDNGISEQMIRRIMNKEIDVPLLGICYGHQLMAHVLGMEVAKGKSAECGISKITVDDNDHIFRGVPKTFNAWGSHFDEVKKLPKGFIKLAHSELCGIEAMRHKERNLFGVQFHPEVWHTEYGEKILKNFLEVEDELAPL